LHLRISRRRLAEIVNTVSSIINETAVKTAGGYSIEIKKLVVGGAQKDVSKKLTPGPAAHIIQKVFTSSDFELDVTFSCKNTDVVVTKSLLFGLKEVPVLSELSAELEIKCKGKVATVDLIVTSSVAESLSGGRSDFLNSAYQSAREKIMDSVDIIARLERQEELILKDPQRLRQKIAGAVVDFKHLGIEPDDILNLIGLLFIVRGVPDLDNIRKITKTWDLKDFYKNLRKLEKKGLITPQQEITKLGIEVLKQIFGGQALEEILRNRG